MANRLNVANIGYNDATDALTIDSSGNVTASGTLSAGTISEAVADAGVTIDGLTLKDGGIQFRTTTGGSGTFGSGTLDDYEEGTFTPTFPDQVNCSSTTVTSAEYRKIGNMVTCWVKGTTSVASSSTRTVFTFTYPFLQKSNTSLVAGGGNVEAGASPFEVVNPAVSDGSGIDNTKGGVAWMSLDSGAHNFEFMCCYQAT